RQPEQPRRSEPDRPDRPRSGHHARRLLDGARRRRRRAAARSRRAARSPSPLPLGRSQTHRQRNHTNMRNQMTLALVAMALGACVGGIDSMSGGDDTPSGSPRQMFDQTVAPLLTAKCAGCHVGPETSSTDMFLGPDGVSSYYSTLTNDRAVNGGFNPDAATILLKGKHDGPPWTSTE